MVLVIRVLLVYVVVYNAPYDFRKQVLAANFAKPQRLEAQPAGRRAPVALRSRGAADRRLGHRREASSGDRARGEEGDRGRGERAEREEIEAHLEALGLVLDPSHDEGAE